MYEVVREKPPGGYAVKVQKGKKWFTVADTFCVPVDSGYTADVVAKRIADLLNQHGMVSHFDKIAEQITFPDDYDDGEEDSEEDRYINHYRHVDCPGATGENGEAMVTTWTDRSPNTNNDRCPNCHTEIEPFESEDI